jgi:hypothetical protein
MKVYRLLKHHLEASDYEDWIGDSLTQGTPILDMGGGRITCFYNTAFINWLNKESQGGWTIVQGDSGAVILQRDS